MTSYVPMFALVLLLVLPADRVSADLVVNGGFETGDFTGWTLVGDPLSNFVDTGFPYSGTYDAAFGQVGSLASLSQTLATNVGTSYALSFWFAGDGDTPSEFTVSIGGTLLLDLVNPPADGYNQYTYNFTATSTSTVLSFGARDDLFFIYLDDVSVVPATVPRPPRVAALNPRSTQSIIQLATISKPIRVSGQE